MVSNPDKLCYSASPADDSQRPESSRCWNRPNVGAKRDYAQNGICERLVSIIWGEQKIDADHVLCNRKQVLAGLYRLFVNPQHLTKKSVGEDDADAGLTAIDHEEQSAGYQAAYSRLAASESVAVDPVGYVNDPLELLDNGLGRLAGEGAFGGHLGTMVSEARALASQPLQK